MSATCVDRCEDVGPEWVHDLDEEFLVYADLFIDAITDEFSVLCTAASQIGAWTSDCDIKTLLYNPYKPYSALDLTTYPKKVCQCAPYYYFDNLAERCEAIPYRIPHCLHQSFFDLTGIAIAPLNVVYDVCIMCEPGYVLEPVVDFFRD